MEGVGEDPEQNICHLGEARPGQCYLCEGSWYHPPVREAQTPDRRMSSICDPIIIVWADSHNLSKNIAFYVGFLCRADILQITMDWTDQSSTHLFCSFYLQLQILIRSLLLPPPLCNFLYDGAWCRVHIGVK